MNSMKISAVALVDKGKKRKNNEDNLFFNGSYIKKEGINNTTKFKGTFQDTAIFAISDGMGGESFGEVASLITVASLAPYTNKFKDAEEDALFEEYLRSANNRICDEMLQSESRMGSTLVTLLIKNNGAKIYNVGDSRAYLLRNGQITQLSKDHNSISMLLDMNLITKEQAAKDPRRHKLMQHLGMFEHEMLLKPHISQQIQIKKDDIFLLCSDGLTEMVSDNDIQMLLKPKKDIEGWVEELMITALNNGGADNISILAVKLN